MLSLGRLLMGARRRGLAKHALESAINFKSSAFTDEKHLTRFWCEKCVALSVFPSQWELRDVLDKHHHLIQLWVIWIWQWIDLEFLARMLKGEKKNWSELTFVVVKKLKSNRWIHKMKSLWSESSNSSINYKLFTSIKITVKCLINMCKLCLNESLYDMLVVLHAIN